MHSFILLYTYYSSSYIYCFSPPCSPSPSLSLSPSQCVAGTDQWQRVNTGMPVKSPRYALFDLEESESYSFRVRCCNSTGVSEASEATSNITVGDKLGQQDLAYFFL